MFVVAGAALAALLVAERRRPRRARTQVEPPRTLTNLALGGAALAVVAAGQGGTQRLAGQVAARRQGLAQALPTPLLRDAAAFLLLDYTMYLWHVATHRVPVLWRLHRVHHVDLDMDASTALRFHAVDMALSIPLRRAQVRLLGVGPRALAVWEAFFGASVLFHHSNLRLASDTRLAWLLTTPGMHDIHHRAEIAATDSNWSSGLSLWDRLHNTLRLTSSDAPIGVPAYPEPVGLKAALALPFAAPNDDWDQLGER
ncbi:sterol desaturase family protein [Glacieibacterium frigidum]|uniref:sterol desaturase family protein n=1 Tax=Glacieibacterium frigidum TaxID=2593303 RepID=UPI00163D4C07|nr:sterol desaturase family protein [Glacieibacterium frigidum]